MAQNSLIVFVCEHGAAKSVIATAYFNRLANEMGVGLRAVARGTNPDPELSLQAVKGLANNGLTPNEPAPRKLTEEEMQSAQRVITFCELPAQYLQPARIERWEDVPSVSEDYEMARDVIVKRIHQILHS